MKFKFLGSHPFTRLFLLANITFWLVFGVFFFLKSYPYRPHKPLFEERAPDLIYFGRALSYLENEQMMPLIRIARVAQWPSFYAASPLNLYFSRSGITVDQQYWGVSVGGYYLFLVFILSFLQWFLVGWLVQKLWNKWFSHSTAAPNQTPSTSTTQ